MSGTLKAVIWDVAGTGTDVSTVMVCECGVDGTVKVNDIIQMAPKTSLIDQAYQVQNLMYGHPGIQVYIDATGIGRGAVDALKSAGGGAVPFEITFHGGTNSTKTGHKISLSKADAVQQLTALLNQNKLTFALFCKCRSEAKKQMLAFSSKKTAAGNLKFEAAGTGHDDIITCLLIAAYVFGRAQRTVNRDRFHICGADRDSGARRSAQMSAMTSGIPKSAMGQWLDKVFGG